MKLFKIKYVGSVMKIYQIFNNIDISIFQLSLDIIKEYTNETLDGLHLNMRHNNWDLNKLLNHIQKTGEKIEFLEAYSSKPSSKMLENSSSISYGVYETLNKKGHFVEVSLNINNYIIKKEDVINIINRYLKIMDIDYGYVFYLKEKQNWIIENNLKTSLFSVTSTIPKGYYEEREKLLEINNGFIPKIYKYNILNNAQIKLLNKPNLCKINDKLSLNEDE
ncbi:MAG: hypothetical protein LBJ88_02555 [Campylobacteraceae bacterium]|jgi:hypothetical protein|nr:hypothetical protein [Campylobacteraceae bacterium]